MAATILAEIAFGHYASIIVVEFSRKNGYTADHEAAFRSYPKWAVWQAFSETTHLLRFESKLFKIYHLRNDGREFFSAVILFSWFLQAAGFLNGFVSAHAFDVQEAVYFLI